ncbi:MAG TPA: hypothetical protein VKT52_05880, partial [Ktedonobacterales bacterium]|nr:hypothetical protein [Ktedonobacterales bacterium]
PGHVIETLSVLWVGPHAALAAVNTSTGDALNVTDLLTGATSHQTPAQLAGNEPEALSGDWIAAIAFGQPDQLNVINYHTGAIQYLGLPPPQSTIAPLGSRGQFLVSSRNGPSFLASAP